jgi:uncharacterized membrane protein YozB (DUF420 family)
MRRLTLAAINLLIFVVSGAINCGILVHLTPDTPPDSVISMWSQIIQTHSVFISILIGGIFTTERRNSRLHRSIATLSIFLSLAWVALILSSWIGYPAHINADGKGGLVEIFGQRSTEASFLIAGMLAYIAGAKGEDRQGG